MIFIYNLFHHISDLLFFKKRSKNNKKILLVSKVYYLYRRLFRYEQICTSLDELEEN